MANDFLDNGLLPGFQFVAYAWELFGPASRLKHVFDIGVTIDGDLISDRFEFNIDSTARFDFIASGGDISKFTNFSAALAKAKELEVFAFLSEKKGLVGKGLQGKWLIDSLLGPYCWVDRKTVEECNMALFSWALRLSALTQHLPSRPLSLDYLNSSLRETLLREPLEIVDLLQCLPFESEYPEYRMLEMFDNDELWQDFVIRNASGETELTTEERDERYKKAMGM